VWHVVASSEKLEEAIGAFGLETFLQTATMDPCSDLIRFVIQVPKQNGIQYISSRTLPIDPEYHLIRLIVQL
jgi:hypothetical protein